MPLCGIFSVTVRPGLWRWVNPESRVDTNLFYVGEQVLLRVELKNRNIVPEQK